MTNSLYRPISKGVAGAKIPLASDVAQFVDMFNGTADVGVLLLAGQVSTLSTGGLSLALASGGTLGIGAYQYKFTFVTGLLQADGTPIIKGETPGSTTLSITTTTGNQKVTISGLPAVGAWPVTAIGIRIYRTLVGGADGTQKLVTTLFTNYLRSTYVTSYLDAIADASLTTSVPTTNTTGTTFPYVDSRYYPLERQVANLTMLSSLYTRVDGASVYFGDLMDGLNQTNGKIDLSSTNATSAIAASGTTKVVPVTGGTTGFAVGQEVTIFDATHLERRNITALVANTSISFAAMTNSYSANAQICRSSVIQDTVNKLLKFGGWSYQTTHTNTAVSVVSAAYDTSGNGGRKVVLLSNGWLIAGVCDTAAFCLRFYKSIDSGTTWTLLCSSAVENSANTGAGFAMTNNGTLVHVLVVYQGFLTVSNLKFDATTVGTTANQLGNPESAAQTVINGNVSLTIDSLGTLHATWCSKNATYPNSDNIRYSKSTDGGVTWATPTQITTYNTAGYDITNPCIVVLANNKPVITMQYTQASGNYIFANPYSGTAWSTANTGAGNVVYAGGTYSQSNPCAAVAPSGRIWCVWHGEDATDTVKNNIRYSYSDDGGATWLSAVKLTSGNSYNQVIPVISIDKNNNVFIMWQGLDSISTLYYNIFRNIWTGTGFQGVTKLTTNTTNDASYPSSIDNNTLDFNLLTPPMIYKDLQATAVKFSGTYTVGSVTAVLVEDVRYNENTASNVSSMVVWVDHDADPNFVITGACSFQASGGVESFASMTKTTAAIDGSHNEDQFSGTGTSAAKATLRLTLTRNSTALVKNIESIMGAVGA